MGIAKITNIFEQKFEGEISVRVGIKKKKKKKIDDVKTKIISNFIFGYIFAENFSFLVEWKLWQKIK